VKIDTHIKEKGKKVFKKEQFENFNDKIENGFLYVIAKVILKFIQCVLSNLIGNN
jgi:hypothetical protein